MSIWNRWLFSARAFMADLGPRLGSWRLSIVLMVVAALYYTFLAIWAGSTPPHVVRNIAGLLPFWLVYLLLLVNTAVCLWRRIPSLKKELSSSATLAERQPDWSLETPPGIALEGVSRLLKGRGYRVSIESDSDRIWGIRHRWAALGTFLFHGAFFLVAVGFLLTIAGRQEDRVWAAVGEDFTGDPTQFLSRSAPRPWAFGAPVTAFRVEDIRPEFWRDQFLFTTLEANLTLASGSRATTRINRPLWLGWGTFLRLSGFGYTPRYELADRNGMVLDSAFVKLNVFPPGQKDYFSPPDYPHRIYLQVYPDYVEAANGPSSQSLNLASPGVFTQVYRGRIALGEDLLRPGDGFDFEGLTLSFPEIRYWGEFTIVRDPGAPLLFLGYLLGIAGLLLKLPGKRAEVEWRPGEQGTPGVLRGWGSQPFGRKEFVEANEARDPASGPSASNPQPVVTTGGDRPSPPGSQLGEGPATSESEVGEEPSPSRSSVEESS